MKLLNFIKHKELAEIANLKEQLKVSKELEEQLSNKVTTLNALCIKLSKYESIADIEEEKNKILAEINEQNALFEETKQQYINKITSLKAQIITISEEIEDFIWYDTSLGENMLSYALKNEIIPLLVKDKKIN